MDDKNIIDLYFDRSENAISETAAKYGGYCFSIAYNILYSNEDSEESVNDTWLAAWNTMPPKRPAVLATFLGKMTRYISLDKWKNRTAAKRGGGEVPLVLEELEECVAGSLSVEDEVAKKEQLERINQFLDKLSKTERDIFLCRYWHMDSIQDIARRFDFSQSKVTSMLHRTRKKLEKVLREEEGLV